MMLCWEPPWGGVVVSQLARSDGVTVDWHPEPSGGPVYGVLGGGRPLTGCVHPGQAKGTCLRVSCLVVRP